jgi:flagellar biogenesis protein FliO
MLCINGWFRWQSTCSRWFRMRASFAMKHSVRGGSLALLLWVLCLLPAAAADIAPPATPPLEGIGPSLVRMIGAFALVMAAGFGLLYVLRRGIRLSPRGSGAQRRLQVLEVRMLGNRQSLFVVGYDDQKLLLASTATGISLLTHLPADTASPEAAASPAPPMAPTFMEALQHAFGRKS